MDEKKRRKQFKDMKLGEKMPKEYLEGEFENLFSKNRARLLKITYTFQDEKALTVDIGLEHKDFYEKKIKQNG